MDIQSIQSQLDQFAKDRDWEKFHSLRNLILALVSEVGELAEIMQWSENVNFDTLQFEEEKRKALEEEIADIFLYLVRIADLAKIDVIEAAQNKIIENSHRYTVDKSKGNSRKQPK